MSMNFTDLDSPASSNSFFSSHSGSGGLDTSSGPVSPSLDGVSPQDAAELQQFINMEQEKARFRAQIQAMTDLCWEKCVGQVSSKMESKTETCLDNCAQRFVDVSLLVTHRFASLLQRQANM